MVLRSGDPSDVTFNRPPSMQRGAFCSCRQRRGCRTVHHRQHVRLLRPDDHGRVRKRASDKDSRMDDRGSDGRRSYRAPCNGRCLEPLSPSCSPMTIARPHAEPFDDSRSRGSDRPLGAQRQRPTRRSPGCTTPLLARSTRRRTTFVPDVGFRSTLTLPRSTAAP